jgi:hypothetical protein
MPLYARTSHAARRVVPASPPGGARLGIPLLEGPLEVSYCISVSRLLRYVNAWVVLRMCYGS